MTANRAVSAEPSAIEDALRILLTGFLGGRVAATFMNEVAVVRHTALVLVNGHGWGLRVLLIVNAEAFLHVRGAHVDYLQRLSRRICSGTLMLSGNHGRAVRHDFTLQLIDQLLLVLILFLELLHRLDL